MMMTSCHSTKLRDDVTGDSQRDDYYDESLPSGTFLLLNTNRKR